MGFNKYPYTDLHEMNLDWIIARTKELIAKWAETSAAWLTQQEAFDSLRNFVNDYFDNLDVQEEINHKLDEMADDGSLGTLISPYVSSELPAVVADQIAGVVASQISAVVAAQLPDEVASQLPDLMDYVTPEMFGAKGDGITDDKTAVQNAFSSGKNVFMNGVYRITNPLVSLTLSNNDVVVFGRGTLFFDSVVYDGTNLGHGLEVSGDNVLINGVTFESKQDQVPGLNIDNNKASIGDTPSVSTGYAANVYAITNKGDNLNVVNCTFRNLSGILLDKKGSDPSTCVIANVFFDHVDMGVNTNGGGTFALSDCRMNVSNKNSYGDNSGTYYHPFYMAMFGAGNDHVCKIDGLIVYSADGTVKSFVLHCLNVGSPYDSNCKLYANGIQSLTLFTGLVRCNHDVVEISNCSGIFKRLCALSNANVTNVLDNVTVHLYPEENYYVDAEGRNNLVVKNSYVVVDNADNYRFVLSTYNPKFYDTTFIFNGYMNAGHNCKFEMYNCRLKIVGGNQAGILPSGSDSFVKYVNCTIDSDYGYGNTDAYLQETPNNHAIISGCTLIGCEALLSASAASRIYNDTTSIPSSVIV